MFKYTNFLFAVLVKKASLYIVFAIFCLLFSGIFVASTNAPGVKFQVLFPISTFTKWFPFVFSTLFILIVIIRIFKTGETDGTELIISSKPVKRVKIVFARFLVLVVLIVVFQLLSFSFFLIITQLDSYATGSQRLKFATSMTIGGLVLGIIVSAIVIIISALIGRIGTLLCGIVFATMVPVLSFTIVPFSGALNPLRRVQQRELVYSSLLGKNQTDGTRQVYSPSTQQVNLTKMSFLPGKSEDYEENKNTWYNGAKYIDTWYQLGRFYSLLEPSQNLKKEIGYDIKHLSYDVVSVAEFKRFYEQANQVAINLYLNSSTTAGKLRTEPNPVGWIGLFTSDEIMFEKNSLETVFNKARYNELTQQGGLLAKEFVRLQQEVVLELLSMGIESPLSLRSFATNEALQRTVFKFLKQKMQALFKLKSQLPSLRQYRVLVWRAIIDFQRNNELRAFSNATEMDELNLWKSWVFKFLFTQNILEPNAINFSYYTQKKEPDEPLTTTIFNNFSSSHYLVKNLAVKKFFTTTPVVISWTIIGLLLLSTSVLIYLRRDFH